MTYSEPHSDEPIDAPDDSAIEGLAFEPEAEPEERRYPSTIGGAIYIVVLLVAAMGLAVVIGSNDWRLGIRILGGSILGAAFFRLILPRRDAGMLAVRHRAVDVTLLTAVGVALILLAGDIPDQPQ